MRTWTDTRLTRLLGIEVPIVLGPFGGMSSVVLAATVSNAGGLGSFGLYGYAADRIAATAAELHRATGKPFGLNVWLPTGDEVDPDLARFEAARERLRPYFDELDLPLPELPERYLPTLDEQLDAVLQVRPKVLSVVFGVPSGDLIERCRARSIVVIGTATTVDEALALEAGGVDAVVATGMEAGGHRVSFLRPAEDSLVGTFALVPRVRDAVSVPVIAAGGIADGRGLAAALVLGADAAQIGTAFLATDQSAAVPAYRDRLRGPGNGRTVLTRALSGRLARGLPNRVIGELADVATAFPEQNWLTGQFRPTAGSRGVTDLMSLWAGQAAPLIDVPDAATLFDTLVRQASAILDRS